MPVNLNFRNPPVREGVPMDPPTEAPRISPDAVLRLKLAKARGMTSAVLVTNGVRSYEAFKDHPDVDPERWDLQDPIRGPTAFYHMLRWALEQGYSIYLDPDKVTLLWHGEFKAAAGFPRGLLSDEKFRAIVFRLLVIHIKE